MTLPQVIRNIPQDNSPRIYVDFESNVALESIEVFPDGEPDTIDAEGVVSVMQADGAGNRLRILEQWNLLDTLAIRVTVIDRNGNRTSATW